jgi:hypothetical protein
MRVLLVHQNFPGQFTHLAQAWTSRPGWDVRALGRSTAPGLPGFERLLRYAMPRAPLEGQHPYLRKMESAVIHGQAVARTMAQMKRQGFSPDVIVAHPGWGETLFAKDVFPDARLVHLCEWYYGAQGGDVGFDPEFPITADQRARLRTWNALHALNLTQCDAAVAPTLWQRSRHPAAFLPKISVQHEGIAIDRLAPDAGATLQTPNGRVFRQGDAVVTYVARNLEPYRGFHVFMRALARLQLQHRSVHALIIGGDDVSYGQPPKDGSTWRERLLSEVNIDLARTHFLGRVPYETYVRVLQVSAAHVYLTYPFVLSWSMLEAMACGCLLIGSDTAPVREVLSHGNNGVMVPFFDANGLADRMADAVAAPERYTQMRLQARLTVGRFSRDAGIAGYSRLIGAPADPVGTARGRARVAAKFTKVRAPAGA